MTEEVFTFISKRIDDILPSLNGDLVEASMAAGKISEVTMFIIFLRYYGSLSEAEVSKLKAKYSLRDNK